MGKEAVRVTEKQENVPSKRKHLELLGDIRGRSRGINVRDEAGMPERIIAGDLRIHFG